MKDHFFVLVQSTSFATVNLFSQFSGTALSLSFFLSFTLSFFSLSNSLCSSLSSILYLFLTVSIYLSQYLSLSLNLSFSLLVYLCVGMCLSLSRLSITFYFTLSSFLPQGHLFFFFFSFFFSYINLISLTSSSIGRRTYLTEGRKYINCIEINMSLLSMRSEYHLNNYAFVFFLQFFVGFKADFLVSVTDGINAEELKIKISNFTALGHYTRFMAVPFPTSSITANGLPSGHTRFSFLIFTSEFWFMSSRIVTREVCCLFRNFVAYPISFSTISYFLVTTVSPSMAAPESNVGKKSLYDSYTYLGFLAFSAPIGIIIAIVCGCISCRRRRGDKSLSSSDYPDSTETDGLRNAVRV